MKANPAFPPSAIRRLIGATTLVVSAPPAFAQSRVLDWAPGAHAIASDVLLSAGGGEIRIERLPATVSISD